MDDVLLKLNPYMPKTYYEILGITIDANPEEIKKAYFKLAGQYHPDHSGNENDGHMVELNKVYEALSDPTKKREYDEIIAPWTLHDFTKINRSVATEIPNNKKRFHLPNWISKLVS